MASRLSKNESKRCLESYQLAKRIIPCLYIKLYIFGIFYRLTVRAKRGKRLHNPHRLTYSYFESLFISKIRRHEMRKAVLTTSLPKKSTQIKLTRKVTSKEVERKRSTIIKFMRDREKWEQGLYTSTTVIC